MNYRNRRLLDLAHRVTECQACGRHTEGCEPAHANWSEFGKGMGLKAHDLFHAAMCHQCHAELDQGCKMSFEDRKAMWTRAYINTQLLYWQNGWIHV